MSKLARCALFFFLSISFVAGVAAQALSPDKSGAAAPARLDLGQKIDDAAKIREQREQDITKMIDALRADLFKLIQETKSGDEQRNAALLQQVNDLRGLLSKQIDDNKANADTRANGLAQSIGDLKMSVDDLKKGIPPWVAIFASVGIAIAGFLVSWAIASSNRSHADTQRTEDITGANQQRNDDITRANQQRTEDLNRSDRERTEDNKRADERRTQDIERADKQRREDIQRLERQVAAQHALIKRAAAYALRGEWGQLHNDISAAGGYFVKPDMIDDKAYSLIVKIGNWYDMFAGRYRDDSVDQSVAEEMKEQAKGFLEQVKRAREALASRPSALNSNFNEELARWQSLRNL